MKKDFEQLPHTADIKIRVYGKTVEELFCNAVIGMFQVIGPHADGCIKKNDRLVCKILPQKRELMVVANDYDSLLVDFLSEALYLSDVNNEAYLDVTIQIMTEQSVEATLHGVPVTRFDVVEIKAVTYHDLHVQKINGGWQTDIVFDI